MPVKDDLIFSYAVEEWIVESGIGKRDRRPADFFHLVRVYPLAQGPCNQLCAQAHSKDGRAAFDCAPDVFNFAGNER